MLTATNLNAASRPRYGGVAALGGGEPVWTLEPCESLLPDECMISNLVYEPLFESTPEGASPLLVESWSADGDSSEWRLVLKKGVTFHDGSPLTAADVAYSLNRLLKSRAGLAGRWLRYRGAVVSIDAPPAPAAAERGPGFQNTTPGRGGRTVIIRTRSPIPDLPDVLSCPALAVLQAPKAGGRFHDEPRLGSSPGTGPFAVKPGASSGRIELVAFEGHHNGRPFLDGVEWKLMGCDDVSIETRAGMLDLYAGPPCSEVASLAAAFREAHIERSSHAMYLLCNSERGALNSEEERLRLFEAINRASILRSIIGGAGSVSQSVLPGGEAWGQVAPGEGAGRREPAPRARSKLTLLAPRWHGVAGEVADRIHVDLLAAGYDVTLRKLGREEMGYKLSAGEFDLSLGLWYPPRWIEDEVWLASHFLHTQIPSASAPAAGLAHDKDRSPYERMSLERELLERLQAEGVVLPMFQLDRAVLVARHLHWAATVTAGVPDMAWAWIGGELKRRE